MTTARTGAAPGDYRAGLLEALRTIEQLRGRIKELDTGARALAEPVAVVGLSCRLPGGARDPEAYWRMLNEGVDATGEFPAERGDAQALYDPDPDAPGKAYTIRGGFLDRVDRFEPAVFGISPREALGMDPQQRLALEVAWEALERAGYAPDGLEGSNTGVYLGVSTTDYVRLRQAQGAAEDVDAYQLMGEPSFVAGRISYTLGLRGPSKVIDTTCSSSLVAVHEACQALRLGECDMALAGGVNLMLAPYGFVLMSKFRALSPDGRCKTFDAAADGYARGEGAGVVTLKRLSDAIRDGDHIAAVIRGSAVGHDGRSSGLTVPNPAAQQQVINGALAQAGIAPADVDYVEAHGTGTALGDPIELRALQAALARHRHDGEPLLVGSVKTNIGHLESAAGIAGLIKLVLALQHGSIPPHLHFDTPNPNVDWSRLQIQVTDARREWPDRGRDRIGAISSFGASGTNAHAVVSSAPPVPAPPVPVPAPTDSAAGSCPHPPYGLLLASARTPEALRETAERYARALRRLPEPALADVCWTTQVGRARQQYGLAVVGDSLDSLAEALDAYVLGADDARLSTAALPAYKHRKAAWLFTGQGAQYPGMGRDLLAEPAFREAFEECERFIDPGLGRPLREVMWPRDAEPAGGPATGGPAVTSVLDDTRYTQPALFALEYALARMWLSWGLRPGALLGHSVGEIAAACVAGVFGVEDACRLVVARAALMAELPSGGAMAAVTCSEAGALAAIEGRTDRLAVAAVNGPAETVLSGEAGELDTVLEELAARGVRGRRLPVSHAFHSPLLEPMLKDFREVAEEIRYAAPALPLVSDVTGRIWGPDEVGPDYWVRHAASAVRFHDGLTALHSDGYRTFLEIGPAPVLAGIGDRALDDADCAWIPSLLPDVPGRPRTEGRATVRRALGLLRLRGAQPDWAAVHHGEEPRRVPLPTTPWRGESYWFTEGARPGAAGTPEAPGRDVPGVGRRLRNAVPTYELDLDGGRWAPLARTDEDGYRYLPLGALAEVTVAAAADALGGSWECVEEIDLLERLPLAREPRGVEPRTVDLRTVESRGMEGRTVEPRNVEFQAVGPQTSESRTAESRAVGPRTSESRAAGPRTVEPRTVQITVTPGENGRAVFAYRSLSRTEEEAGAPWRLHVRGVLRHLPLPTAATPVPVSGLQVGRYTDRVEYEPAVLSEALAGAVTGAHRGAGGVLVALDPARGGGSGLVGVMDAAVAALSWDAGQDRPGAAVAGFASHVGLLTCTDPGLVRYVRAAARPRTGLDGLPGDEVVGGVEFFAEDGAHLGGIGELRVVPASAVSPQAAPWRRPEDLLTRVDWQPLPLPGRTPSLAGESWLLLPDRGGVAARLAAEVRARGAHCLVADAAGTGPDPEAIGALLTRWRAEAAGGTPGAAAYRVVLLTALDAPSPEEADPDLIEGYRDRTELTAVTVVQQLLQRARPGEGVPVSLVTRGTQPAGPGGTVDPFGAALWGLGRVLALEHAEFWGGAVDLGPLPEAGDGSGARVRGGGTSQTPAGLTGLVDLGPLPEAGDGSGARVRGGGTSQTPAGLTGLVDLGPLPESGDGSGAWVRGGGTSQTPAGLTGLVDLGPLPEAGDGSGARVRGGGTSRTPAGFTGLVDLGPLPESGDGSGARVRGGGTSQTPAGLTGSREHADAQATDDETRTLLAALTDSGEDQQALRGGTRYVARLVPHALSADEQRARPVLRSGASYLVTGAFGGIGQVLCRWLAAGGAGRLVLLGRGPLPDRADWDVPALSPEVRARLGLVRELESMGVEVEVVVADVADPVAMRQVVEELSAGGRPLRGVVHAAGTSVPQFLRDIPVGDPREYDAVWRPKVIGGWLLHQLTDGLELDFFLNFSSIAATWGSQHLTSYAAGNAFLDALAEHRHARGLPALTVSWGPWDLPSNLFGDDVLAFLTATGLRPLSAPQCLRLLGAFLAGKAPHAVVCAADWSVYKPVMEARGDRPLLRTVELPEEEGQSAASPVLDALASAAGGAQRRALLVPYLQQVLGEVLGVPARELAPESDVLANGLDSLMVMEVVKRCKRDLRVALRPNQFFEQATLEDWAGLLADTTAGPGSASGSGPGSDDRRAPALTSSASSPWTDPARIAEDVTLDPAIRPGAPLSNAYTAPREVLLTGATGFLGAYLLDELLATTDATVHCLVRCADPAQGLARVRANHERYLPWRTDADERIAVVPGDLGQPLLGLAEDRFDALANRLDAIYHNGALVNFSYTYEQSRPVNLAGTEEILRLACRGPLTPVSHVSTYGIWGLPSDGRTVITEDDAIDGAGKLVTGYVQTKWAAERLVELARERGIPVDVHRPGRVLGDSRTGACLTTHFTTRVIKGCVQLGLAPALDLEIEMTPVDYVTGSLVRISREEHPFGATYHLVNRHKMRFRDLIAAMVARGWRIETVRTETWWDRLRDGFAEAGQENALHPVMEVVEEFVVGGEEAIDYDAARAERALSASGISCPPLDEALLGTYFDWMIRSGYLPEPGR